MDLYEEHRLDQIAKEYKRRVSTEYGGVLSMSEEVEEAHESADHHEQGLKEAFIQQVMESEEW